MYHSSSAKLCRKKILNKHRKENYEYKGLVDKSDNPEISSSFFLVFDDSRVTPFSLAM